MTYVHGQHNAVCDRCGFEYKSGQLRKEWTGLMVCSGGGTNNCWEPRHPQDFVKGRKDKQAPEWVRPEPPDVVRSEHRFAELLEGDALDVATVEEAVLLEGDSEVEWTEFVVELEGDAR